VPSKWFGGGALGLSRAVMDNNLFRRAEVCGATILESASVTDVIEEKNQVRGVRLKVDEVEREYEAPITIDATGRARVLIRKLKQQNATPRLKPKLIAFKAHLENTRVAEGACEIYFYSGGYGGLSTIQGGISNLCFITAANDVRRCSSNPDVVLNDVVMRNRRAAYTLESASTCSEWLSVSLESFGRQRPSPMKGLLAVGDSAAFIDPFTGSGMLMALESGELASRLILRHLESLRKNLSLKALGTEYSREYRRKFDSRLRICSVLRRAAFRPVLAEVGIVLCSASERLRNRIALATRSESHADQAPPEPVKLL
jgi:flavin-dependent dehydrogenase